MLSLYSCLPDDDEDKTLPNTPVTIPALNNDKNSDGTLPDTVASITTQPTNGEVAIQPDGTVVYTPNTDFVGRDPFTYEICDDIGCDGAQATVTISSIVASEYNPSSTQQRLLHFYFHFDFPITLLTLCSFHGLSEDDEAKTLPDTTVTIPVLDNDEESDGSLSDSVNNATKPANGSVITNPDGTADYTPESGFEGTLLRTRHAMLSLASVTKLRSSSRSEVQRQVSSRDAINICLVVLFRFYCAHTTSSFFRCLHSFR